jgi:hypothetical protein
MTEEKQKQEKVENAMVDFLTALMSDEEYLNQLASEEWWRKNVLEEDDDD